LFAADVNEAGTRVNFSYSESVQVVIQVVVQFAVRVAPGERGKMSFLPAPCDDGEYY
jgi:hypothetical protein